MHSTYVVFILLFLAWNSSALPCDGWSTGETHDVGDITCPEEVILVTFSEDGDDDETYGVPYRISTDVLDHNLSGEVVESAANQGNSHVSNYPPAMVSSSQMGNEVTLQPSLTNEDEDVVATTVSGNVKE